MQDTLYQILLCDYINAVSDKEAILQRDGCLVLKKSLDTETYKIVDSGPRQQVMPNYYKKCSMEVVQRPGMLALPAFFDMHFHWVQDAVCLMNKNSLIEWLKSYTWPYEARFEKGSFSQKKAQEFAKKLLQVGTVGGACYGSVHAHTVDHALEFFVGDYIIGNVLMTRQSPPNLLQSDQQALKIVKAMIKKHDKRYVITPRFALTISPDLMKEVGKLARQNRCFIQSHLSENKDEISAVMDLYSREQGFQHLKTYTEVYHKGSLLGPRTIMGHGIHLNDGELKLLAKTKTKIAHCPSSNAPIAQFGLGSGLFDFQKIERYGIDWALGSDIGAGPYLSMLDVMRSFVMQNKKRYINKATYSKALFRATLASAMMMGLGRSHGNLTKGKYANIVFVPSPRAKRGEDVEDVLKRLISQGMSCRSMYDQMVMETIYKGKTVYVS